MFMNNQCLFTVCSRAREHEHLGEQLVNSAAASVEQDRVVLHVAAADVLVQCGRPRRRRKGRAEGLYGIMPILASSLTSSSTPRTASMTASLARALNAESICERILRAGGLVLDDGNTMLADATLEKLTLLRINRGFMEFMREHYNHLSRQDFKMTVVREKDNSDGDTEEEEAAK